MVSIDDGNSWADPELFNINGENDTDIDTSARLTNLPDASWLAAWRVSYSDISIDVDIKAAKAKFRYEEIYVDFIAGDASGSGLLSDPVDTLGTASRLVSTGGTIYISHGNSSETPSLEDTVTLRRNGSSGIVRIGAQP